MRLLSHSPASKQRTHPPPTQEPLPLPPGREHSAQTHPHEPDIQKSKSAGEAPEVRREDAAGRGGGGEGPVVDAVVPGHWRSDMFWGGTFVGASGRRSEVSDQGGGSAGGSFAHTAAAGWEIAGFVGPLREGEERERW
ncbi:hypothetical protein MMC13_008321 [Lambiella insularis]|nr:hypothetical protein [Lambiella insularis]